MVIGVTGITGILVLKSVAGIIKKLSSLSRHRESPWALQVYAFFLYQTPGIYRVKQLVWNSNGCGDSIEHIVQVFELPNPDFQFIESCLGDTTKFINLSSSANGQTISPFW